MHPVWILVPAPDLALLNRLADRYERTGEGEAELATAFERTVQVGVNLASYAIAVAGRPSRS
jgi:hypothetical protein